MGYTVIPPIGWKTHLLTIDPNFQLDIQVVLFWFKKSHSFQNNLWIFTVDVVPKGISGTFLSHKAT